MLAFLAGLVWWSGAAAQNPRRFVPGQLIVKLSPSSTALDASALRASVDATVTRRYDTIGAELWQISGLTVEDAVERFRRDPRVAYAEPNFIVQAHGLVPNDPRFPELWGMHNTGQLGGTPDADIDAPEAWAVTTGNPVLVGVIDTGVDMNHADLVGHIYTNPGEIAGNGVDDDHNGFVDDVHGWDFANGDNNPADDNGHGTHVSGTIAATGNNSIGVAGVCWSATILPLKFLDANGFGSTDAAIQAVQYATLMGVRLTNNSWGGGAYSSALRDAIQVAADHGILFVASAGNDGSNNDLFPAYPSSYNVDNVIAVGSTDRNDLLSSFSNFGVSTVDLCAPGSGILSTIPGSVYATASGTSMAAPHVSGAIALVWSVAPQLPRATIKSLLLASVDPRPSLAGVVATGGRLNVHAFLVSLDETAPAAVTDLGIGETGSTTVRLTWSASGDDGNTGTASQYDLRYSTSPIDSASFAGATPAGGTPSPQAPGAPESFEVAGLSYQTTYYFALVVADDRGNRSPVSNLASGTTLGAPHLVFSPPSLSASQHRGGREIKPLTLRNDAEGTLDFTAHGPGWVGVTPAAGRIAAGDSLRLDVTFDATNLAAGDHDSTLAFATNAPGQSNVTVPLSLHVTDAADVAVTPGAIDFGVRYTGTCAEDTVTVTNIGSLPLEVSAVTTSVAVFTSDGGSFTLEPGASRAIRVTFCPLSPAAHADGLVVASNDPDHPLLVVALTGEGVDPPVVGVAPSSLSEDLYTGGKAQRLLSISNQGGSDLDFEVSVEPGEADSLSIRVDVVGAAAPGAVIATGRPLDAAALGKLKSFPRRIAVPGAVDRGAVARHRGARPALQRVTSPNLEEVFGSMQNAFFGDERTRGNIFACTVDTRLLEHRFYLESPAATQMWFMVYEGLEQAGQYNLVSASDVGLAGPGDGWYSSGPIDVRMRAGRFYLVVTTFEGEVSYFNEVGITPYPVAASFGGLIAGAGWTWAPETVFPPAPAQQVMPDAFGEPVAYYQTLVTRGAVRWCSVAPDAGTVPAGSGVDVQVEIDAAGMNGGDYHAVARVTSNDPKTPEVVVPVDLHVTGAPDIALSRDAIDFGTRFIGAVVLDTLTVSNPGTDWLSVNSVSTNHPAYAASPPSFALAPGGSRDVTVVFAPAGTGSFPATLTIQSNDPDETSLNVPLAGAGVEPPIAGVQPLSLSRDLYTGETATDYLTISNTGPSPLDFEIAARRDDAAAVSWRISPATRSPAASSVARPGASSDAPHPGDAVHPMTAAPTNPPVLVIQDRSAWGVNMQAFIHDTFGIVATLINSQQIDSTRFDDFDLIITTGDQSSDYYQSLTSHQGKFDSYVNGGGVVQYQAATQGDDVELVGGVSVVYGSEEQWNDVLIPSHPIVKGLPALLEGDWANHTHLVNLPQGARIITQTHDSQVPTTVEYRHGAGYVIATGMTWEFLWSFQYPAGAMMPNAVAYALSLAGVPWLDFEPRSGTVAPGESLPVAVRFDAYGLYGGTYRAQVQVHSNDPITPVIDVAAELRVTGAPDIAVADTLLDFGARFVGAVVVDSLTIANAGTEVLVVSAITSDHPAYTPDATSFDLPPGAQRVVHVAFAPQAVEDMPAVLTITSNDIGTPVTTVALRGAGIEAPVIVADPLSFDESLQVGDQVTRTLAISNSGGNPLSFEIGLEYLASARAGAATATPPVIRGPDRSRDITPVVDSHSRAQGKSFAGARRGSHASPSEAALPPDASAGGLKVLLLHVGAVYDVRSRLLAFADLATVDLFDIGSSTPTLSALRDYDAVILINDLPPALPDLLGDVLADYVDEGGGVIMTLASFIGGWDVRGRFQSGGYYPFTIGSGPVGAATMAQFDAGHPIMQGVTSAFGDVLGATSVATGANEVAWWSNGFPFVATRGTRVVGINVFLADGGYWAGDVPRILRNAVAWCAGRSWLGVNPADGVVAPHSRAEVSVTMDAGRLVGGDYRANLRVASNDPLNGLVVIPAHVKVSGVPDIAFADTLLDFGTRIIGSSTTDTLYVSNAGTDLLTVSSIVSAHAAFTVDPAGFSVAPGATHGVAVTFVPSAVTPVASTVTITSDDPDEGVAHVAVEGAGVEPPVIGIEPDSLAVALLTGQEKREDLRISNTGVSPLHFAVKAVPSTSFSVNMTATTPDPAVLVIQDAPAWGLDLGSFIATRFGVDVTTVASAQMDSVDFRRFNLVVTAGGQSAQYYQRISVADDRLADFALHGGVVQYNVSNNATGLILARSVLVMPGNAEASNTVIMRAHPIAAGLGPLVTADLVNLGWIDNLPPDAKVITKTKISGTPTTVEYRWGRGTVIATGMTWEHLYQDGFPAGKILENGIAYALNLASVSWVDAYPAQGTVAPGATETLAVMFNAEGRVGGTYRALLVVESDDPARPAVATPVSLQVTAAPDVAYEVSGPFHPLYVGDSETVTLEISNQGAEMLAVSALAVDQPDFVVSPDGFLLAPGQAKLLPLTFAPTRSGSIGATLTVVSNDPDEGSLAIPLFGIGRQPAPAISISPSGVLFLGNVPIGGKASQAVTVSNSGIGPLTVSGITPDHPEYTVDPDHLLVPEKSARDVEVIFQPTALGPVIGTLTFTSNDSDHGTVSLTVAGVGVEPPVIEIGADAVTDTLKLTARATHTLAVRNTGTGELDLRVRVAETAPSAAGHRVAADGHGGPDAYGYRWRDNSNATGPVFEWIGAQDGTNVAFGANGFAQDLPLGFTFEYYGTAHKTIGASRYGWLGFGAATVGFPAQVPFADAFDGVIAPMARALMGARYVRCKTVGDAPHRKFVIEYNEVWNGDQVPPTTFEVILSEGSNTIRFQYASAGIVPVGFGIESPDETTGLGNGVAGGLLDPAMVHDGYAIEFSNLPSWLAVEPAAVTVAPGDSTELTVTLDALDLEEGRYSADVIITSNDPARTEVVVPVSLLVSDKLTPVLITRFDAIPLDDGVELRWELSADEEIRGFRIYRSDPRDGTPVDITASGMLGAGARSYRDTGAQRGSRYRYQLAAVVVDREIVSRIVIVETAPYELALEQNHPNPFNPSTTISFTLAERARVLVVIFDVGGRPVRTLVDGTLGPGRHQYPWNGQNESGEVATSGVYFCRLTSGKQTLTRKMVLLK